MTFQERVVAAALWFGHYWLAVAVAAWGYNAAYHVAIATVDLPELAVQILGWVDTAFAAAFFAAIAYHLTVHRRVLCERDMHEAPLQPEVEAARRDRRLRLVHRRVVFWSLLVVPAGMGLLATLAGGAGTVDAEPWALGLMVLRCVPVVYLMMAYAAHHRLQPWCPYCDNGGGLQEGSVDVPDPTGVRPKPVTV